MNAQEAARHVLEAVAAFRAAHHTHGDMRAEHNPAVSSPRTYRLSCPCGATHDVAEIDYFFAEYVTWMRNDIAREIDWFKDRRSAGNLLCALGLVVYTEALGRLWRWNFERPTFMTEDGRERPQLNFEVGFDRLGGGTYGAWRRLEFEATHPDTSLYEVLRSGMVHEYRPKVPAYFFMDSETGRRGVTYEQLRLGFFVIPYHRDFCTMADQLHIELRTAEREITLPDPHLREGPNVIYVGPNIGTIPEVSLPSAQPTSTPIAAVTPSSSAVASTNIDLPTTLYGRSGAVASGADLQNVPREWLRPKPKKPDDKT